METCESYKQDICLYVDGSLEPSRVKELMTHLDNCEDCREYYEIQTALIHMLGDLPELEVPEGLHHSIMESVKNEMDRARVVKINHKPAKILNFKRIVFASGMYAACVLIFLCLVGLFGQINIGVSQSDQYFAPAAAEAEAVADNKVSFYATPLEGAGQAVETDEENSRDLGRAYDAGLTQTEVYGTSEAQSDLSVLKTGALENGVITLDEAEFLFYEYTLVLNTEDFDGAVRVIEDLGVTTDSELVYDEDGRSGSFVKFVSVDGAESILNTYKELGTPVFVSERAENITVVAIANDARLTAKTEEYERLLPLYQNTGNVGEMMYLGDRIVDVINEIDECNSNLTEVDLYANNSVIKLSIVEAPPTEYSADKSLWEQMASSLSVSWNKTGQIGQNLLVAMAGLALPLLIVGLIVGGIMVSKKYRKKG